MEDGARQRRDAAPPAVAPSLSLVIPAYNEAGRIAGTIETSLTYLTAQPYDHELLVVDDGSTDETAAIADGFARRHPSVRLLTVPHGGKATAVRAGVAAAGMDLVAFADADLATPLDHLAEFRASIARGCDVAIGSREGQGARRLGEPAYRHLMGRAFNLLVRLLVLPGIQDTQCGFKLFTREAARRIMSRARLYADPARPISGPRVTAFDVELLVVARRQGLKICVHPIVWTYGEQSKVNPLRDTWTNLLDVLKVRWNDTRGRYR